MGRLTPEGAGPRDAVRLLPRDGSRCGLVSVRGARGAGARPSAAARTRCTRWSACSRASGRASCASCTSMIVTRSSSPARALARSTIACELVERRDLQAEVVERGARRGTGRPGSRYTNCAERAGVEDQRVAGLAGVVAFGPAEHVAVEVEHVGAARVVEQRGIHADRDVVQRGATSLTLVVPLDSSRAHHHLAGELARREAVHASASSSSSSDVVGFDQQVERQRARREQLERGREAAGVVVVRADDRELEHDHAVVVDARHVVAGADEHQRARVVELVERRLGRAPRCPSTRTRA